MSDAEIRFENEGLGGIVAVGSYLADTLKRFGIRPEQDCEHFVGKHYCELTVSSGTANLSPLTKVEREHFAVRGRRSNERLACEAKIIKPGEVVIMTNQKKETPNETGTADAPKDKFKEEFDALPLEKKIAYLMRMEAVTLSETVAYVVNSPMKVIEKVGDVMAEFGMKLEQEARKARRPSDEPVETGGSTGDAVGSKGRSTSRKTPPRASKL
jgi:ferredoxin